MKNRDKNNNNVIYKDFALHYKNVAKVLRCTAAVHVEASIDKDFWQKVLKHFLPQNKFHFITYTKTKDNNNATGCETCLMYKKLDCLSKEFFICIDSDYRYLLKEKNLNSENFVFQTYTYSIENHWCYIQNINNVFEKSGLQNTIFDFKQFLESYSETLYELFLYHLHSLRVNDNFFKKGDFIPFLNISKPCFDSSKMINELNKKINPELQKLKHHYPNVSLEKLEDEYFRLGLKKKNAYLFFRGHNVFEQVVLKIAIEIKNELQKEQQTKQLPGGSKKIYYDNIKKEDFIKYFSEDLYFDRYDEIIRIKKDIQYHFNK